MSRTTDFRKLYWRHQPSLSFIDETQVVVETEPFTDLSSQTERAAAELSFPVHGSFLFEVSAEAHFVMPFDECGVIMYNDKVRSAVIGLTSHNDMTNQLRCTVFHERWGDISCRELGSRIERMHYRVWYRSGMVRIQYSFNGDHWQDMRKFRVAQPKKMGVGLYACSPLNSSFDAVFKKLNIEEGE